MTYGYHRIYDEEEEREQEVAAISWRRLHHCHSKLVTTSQMATLMSFFAVTSAVELKLSQNETSEFLIVSLVVTTALLVAATILVKTVACSLIPYLESVAEVSLIEDVTRSPHEDMILFINISWLIGTIVLPFLFVADLIIMIWIQFRFLALEAAYISTVILLPLLVIILAFGIVFFKQIIKPDAACIQLSRKSGHTFERQHSTRSDNGLTISGSTVSSVFTYNSAENYDEKRTLLPENQLFSYTSYGSTVPNSVISLYGFFD